MKRGMLVLLLFSILIISSCEPQGSRYRFGEEVAPKSYNCPHPSVEIQFEYSNGKVACRSLDEIDRNKKFQEELFDPKIEKYYPTYNLDYNSKEFSEMAKFWDNMESYFNVDFPFFTTLSGSYNEMSNSYSLTTEDIDNIRLPIPNHRSCLSEENPQLVIFSEDRSGKCYTHDKITYRNVGSQFFDPRFRKIIGSQHDFVNIIEGKIKIKLPGETYHPGNGGGVIAADCIPWGNVDGDYATVICWGGGGGGTTNSCITSCGWWDYPPNIPSSCGANGECNWNEIEITRGPCTAWGVANGCETEKCVVNNDYYCDDCLEVEQILPGYCDWFTVGLGGSCELNTDCIGSELPMPTAFCDDITNSNNPTCQPQHCGNGVLETQFSEECDDGGSNAWWGSDCLPNCRISGEGRAGSRSGPVNTGIPCDSDSDSIPNSDWYCPTDLPNFITSDTLCVHGFNVWDAGTVNSEFYNSGDGQSDRCVDGPMGLKFLEEYWCDLSENCNGQGCVMKQGNIDCAALIIDPETAEVDPSVEGYTISCPDSENPTARPRCEGYPSPPEMPTCGNGMCGDCVCVNSEDWTASCNGATCEWEDCDTCPTDCGVCRGNGECDNGDGNVANAGEFGWSDCTSDLGLTGTGPDGSQKLAPDDPSCLSQDHSGDSCPNVLNGGLCGPFETIQNSPADCTQGDYFVGYNFVFVGGMDDDGGCSASTSTSIGFGLLDSGTVWSWGDCSWTHEDSTDGCVAYAMEDDCGYQICTGTDDCAKGIIGYGTIIDDWYYSGASPYSFDDLGNWVGSLDATEPGNWWDNSGSDAACVLDEWRYAFGLPGSNNGLSGNTYNNIPTFLCTLVEDEGEVVYAWLKCDKYRIGDVHYDTHPGHDEIYTCTETTFPCTYNCGGVSTFSKYEWVTTPISQAM